MCISMRAGYNTDNERRTKETAYCNNSVTPFDTGKLEKIQLVYIIDYLNMNY